MKINLKHTLMLALFVGSGATAILPATAIAKKGDLYLNKDGSRGIGLSDTGLSDTVL